MKIYIKSAEEYDPDNRPDLPSRPDPITNEYLNILFKRIDWDDIDYGDRLIDRTIKKELGVDNVFDQAEYINMLDEGTKDTLMTLLENPDQLHAKRMKGRKKSSKRSAKTSSCTLEVKYEDYPDGNVKKAKFEGADLRSALIAMVNDLLLYLDQDEIEDNNMSAEDIIESIEERNGDGCDFIIILKDLSTGKVLMDYQDYYEEEMWEGDL